MARIPAVLVVIFGVFGQALTSTCPMGVDHPAGATGLAADSPAAGPHALHGGRTADPFELSSVGTRDRVTSRAHGGDRDGTVQPMSPTEPTRPSPPTHDGGCDPLMTCGATPAPTVALVPVIAAGTHALASLPIRANRETGLTAEDPPPPRS